MYIIIYINIHRTRGKAIIFMALRAIKSSVCFDRLIWLCQFHPPYASITIRHGVIVIVIVIVKITYFKVIIILIARSLKN